MTFVSQSLEKEYGSTSSLSCIFLFQFWQDDYISPQLVYAWLASNWAKTLPIPTLQYQTIKLLDGRLYLNATATATAQVVTQ